MDNKFCNKCQKDKTIENFSKDASKKSGYRSVCKDCDSFKNKQYWKDNKEILSVKNKEYQQENKIIINEQHRIYSIQYREDNREKLKEQNKEYYQRKKEKRLIENPLREGYKLCRCCNVEKLLKDFSFKIKAKNQRQSFCKSCQKISQKERYSKNLEKMKVKNKKYREKNKEILNIQSKKYYKNNKDKITKQKRTYNKENKKAINTYKREYKNNRYKTDIQFRLKENISARIRTSIKKSKSLKKNRTNELIGCTIPQLRLHLESRFLPTMSWENYGTEWHIDHMKPCSSFDLTDIEQQKLCFHYTNLQPLWATTRIIDDIEYIGNLNKGDSIITEYKRKIA